MCVSNICIHTYSCICEHFNIVYQSATSASVLYRGEKIQIAGKWIRFVPRHMIKPLLSELQDDSEIIRYLVRLRCDINAHLLVLIVACALALPTILPYSARYRRSALARFDFLRKDVLRPQGTSQGKNSSHVKQGRCSAGKDTMPVSSFLVRSNDR